MGFVASTTPDITEGTTAPLSARVTAMSAATRNHSVDVQVGGIGFLIDPDGPRDGVNGPYIRQSVPVRKDQTDTSDEPGEQSLDGYWLRSQASWHRGAGINYYEPGAEEETAHRFTESSGLDVWTPGQVMALHKMTNVQASAGNCYVMDAGSDGTTQYVVYLSDTAILGWDGPNYTASLNTPAAGHNGRYYFFGYKNYCKVGWVSPKSPTVGVWNGATNTVVANNATLEPKVWYVKDRYVVSHGANLFEVPPLTTTPIDLSDDTTAIHKPQDQNTVWLSVVDGPAAIYAAHRGGIVRFSLEDAGSGSTPKLSQAYRVLELPSGETLKTMYGYLGRFLILSTSQGIRVAAIDGNGGLVLGQLIMTPTGNVTAMSASGDIVYLAGEAVPAHGSSGGSNIPGWGTDTGLLALNLGQVIDGNALRFAYANDERAQAVDGTATGCLVIGSTKYLAINGSGIWKTHTDYVSGGYLALGRIRFNTLAKKIYKSFDLAGHVGEGTLRVDILDEFDNSYHSATMGPTTGLYENVALPLTSRHTFVRPLGTFTWSTGTPPVLNLIQMRAIPSPARIRQIRFPLKCHDLEMDRNGQRFGRDNFAYDRLRALEEIEESGLPVVIKDNRIGEQFTGVIDEIDYQNTVGPDKANDNFAGTIRLTVTKIG